jgi:hypothetical protein
MSSPTSRAKGSLAGLADGGGGDVLDPKGDAVVREALAAARAVVSAASRSRRTS